MKSKLLKFICFFLLFFFFSISTKALSSSYKDIVKDIVNIEEIETSADKINIYLFYSETCPHCHKELLYFETLKQSNYQDKINIYTFEVSDQINNANLKKVKELFKENRPGVPYTVIGEQAILGFGDTTSDRIQTILNNYLKEDPKEESIKEENTNYKLPLLGKIDVKNYSIFLIALVLGLIDGFNPCAMWILLLLINMSLNTKNRKKMFLVGLTFILTSGLVYFLSMLGIGFIVDLATITIIRDLIAIVAIILGIYNLITYIKTRKETGCHVVKKEKRKFIIEKINNILESKSFLLGLLGTIILALSVNLVELACSLGFPTIFLEILSLNNILGFQKIIYLFVYIIFYLLDDLIIFLIAVFTLKTKGISTKYNKIVNLVGGILMIIMGILLIFKPEWIMLNF